MENAVERVRRIRKETRAALKQRVYVTDLSTGKKLSKAAFKRTQKQLIKDDYLALSKIKVLKKSRIDEMVKEGILKPISFGDRKYFSRAEIENYIRSGKK